ncbi:MarR family winged helix-turn-helix transcriptional regulator [Rothia nasisuis]|uniref:MarR family winged helix-turn-helix transcriptional regulator n=1 Tax=Rothia nasisuis TaxID=2109647 RepID=UPI001F2D9BDB|nr:MarR family transcriptional regulator [Rothia nasisuis]
MNQDSSLALDQQLCFSLYRSSRAVTRAYQQHLGKLGLTYPQYLVMLVMWESPDGLGMKDLVARLDLDSGTLTPLIKRLIDHGLLTKTRDPRDERRTLLSLTPAGQKLKGRAKSVPGAIYAACAVEGLDILALKAELDTLAEHLLNDKAGD